MAKGFSPEIVRAWPYFMEFFSPGLLNPAVFGFSFFSSSVKWAKQRKIPWMYKEESYHSTVQCNPERIVNLIVF